MMRQRSMWILVSVAVLTACLVSSGFAQKPGQAVSVYVIALKGECQPGWQQRPGMMVNGRSVVMTPGAIPSPAQGNNPQTILTRFLEDPISKHLAEEEFRKNKTFRVVDSPDQADFVFCVCSQYRDLKLPPEVLNKMKMPPTLRIGTQASAVFVASYLKAPNDAIAQAEVAFWKSDHLTPEQADEQASPQGEKEKKNRKDKTSVSVAMINGQSVEFRPEILPYDLARRFIKRWPELAEKLAAQSKAQTVPVMDVSEKALPGLQSDSGAAKEFSARTPAASAGSESLQIETWFILLPVMATDRDGKYWSGLKASDFEIYEDGVQQEVAVFGDTELPIHVVLMLDVSGSTRFKLEDIQDAALNFVTQLRSQDRVMVVSFDEQVRVDSEFTNDREKLTSSIRRTRPGGGTRLVDAMDLVLTERLNKIRGRKAIVVFTDGVDNSSWLTDWEGLTARLEESDVIVYPVRYDTLPEMTTPPNGINNVRFVTLGGGNKKEYERAAQNLKDLAIHSGGRYHEVSSINDTKHAFANIADELRKYYWLGYYPANTTRDGRYRKIQVIVRNPEVTSRTRAGYRPGSESDVQTGEKGARRVLKNSKP
ncbi:MAG TPA: VWA domain-containing protein [Blastocatellia bacterium]|nr:VWA domain-containing protein [Blastocatellia bacterium]